MSEMKKETIQMAQEAFGKLIQEESGRIERMKSQISRKKKKSLWESYRVTVSDRS